MTLGNTSLSFRFNFETPYCLSVLLIVSLSFLVSTHSTHKFVWTDRVHLTFFYISCFFRIHGVPTMSNLNLLCSDGTSWKVPDDAIYVEALFVIDNHMMAKLAGSDKLVNINHFISPPTISYDSPPKKQPRLVVDPAFSGLTAPTPAGAKCPDISTGISMANQLLAAESSPSTYLKSDRGKQQVAISYDNLTKEFTTAHESFSVTNSATFCHLLCTTLLNHLKTSRTGNSALRKSLRAAFAKEMFDHFGPPQLTWSQVKYDINNVEETSSSP